MGAEVEVIFSGTVVEEIGQIKEDNNFEKHFIEHYELLGELQAKFIDPFSKKLVDGKPHLLALKYTKNKKNSYFTPQAYLERILDDFNRKIAGLPIDRNFEEIENSMKQIIEDIVNSTIKELLALDVNNFDEPIKNIFIMMKESIPLLLKKFLETFNPLFNFDNIPLGVNHFREDGYIRELMDFDPPISKLINEIEQRWVENKFIEELSVFNKNLIENKILFAYTLLNWLGYYADDFTKIINRKDRTSDRFNASINDMKHASYASIGDFFISNDEKLRKKTIVSYTFANVKTIVCTPETFLKEYYFNIKLN